MVELGPRYNIAPFQPVPSIQQGDGQRTIALIRWGLVPSRTKDMSIDYKIDQRPERNPIPGPVQTPREIIVIWHPNRLSQPYQFKPLHRFRRRADDTYSDEFHLVV
ncbi:MAG TPA: SOS response-associated peptidase family protein [Terriglobia bacterium]|nr:SOS response-associated peptidase family protein [Terriglobia bacterium]